MIQPDIYDEEDPNLPLHPSPRVHQLLSSMNAIAGGTFGILWKSTDPMRSECPILKVANPNGHEELAREWRMLTLLHQNKAAPIARFDPTPLLDEKGKLGGFWMEELIPIRLREYVEYQQDIVSAMRVLHDMNIAHNDMHHGNIMFRQTANGKQVVLIDFARAATAGEDVHEAEIRSDPNNDRSSHSYTLDLAKSMNPKAVPRDRGMKEEEEKPHTGRKRRR